MGLTRKKIAFCLKVYHNKLSSLVYLIFLRLHPDRWFNQEGEKIQIGTFTFEILHLPGHTPGHIGFIEHEKILLLLAMFFSKTVLVVQTSLVEILIH